MVRNEEIEQHLRALEGVSHVQVQGDGYQYKILLVSDHFYNKSKVARQQWVYAHLKEFILTGMLHAVTMQTWTKEEWETQQNG